MNVKHDKLLTAAGLIALIAAIYLICFALKTVAAPAGAPATATAAAGAPAFPNAAFAETYRTE
jgi:hypothetical protein